MVKRALFAIALVLAAAIVLEAQTSFRPGLSSLPSIACLSGCGASGVALKRASTGVLHVRTGDDTGYAAIVGASVYAMVNGVSLTARDSAAGNPDGDAAWLYLREDIDVGAGTATADCALRVRTQAGVEVNVVTVVTDGGCP